LTDIVDAALALIAVDGVENLSMRQLSTALGASVGATYRHVATKEELLALCGQELYHRGFRPRTAEEEPLTWLREQMIRLYDTIRAYPGMAGYILSRQELVTSELIDAVNEALAATGVPEDLQRGARLVLFFYSVGVLQAGDAVLAASAASDGRAVIAAGLDYILLAGSARGRRRVRLR
jgi:AcrR family transcriptional regulator